MNNIDFKGRKSESDDANNENARNSWVQNQTKRRTNEKYTAELSIIFHRHSSVAPKMLAVNRIHNAESRGNDSNQPPSSSYIQPTKKNDSC